MKSLFTKLLPALLLFLPLTNNAQIQMCIDQAVEQHDVAAGSGSGVYAANTQWSNGSTIAVKFTGGSAYVRGKVQLYAKLWENYANIRFNFISSGTADILISFNEGGSWSQIGTNSKAVAASGRPSMNFGWFNESTQEDEFKATTLHEFGHALGLLHEHMNPLSNIKWNLPVVYNYYFMKQGWSKEQVDQQVLTRYSVDLSNQVYDPVSIMHYPVDARLTLNGYSVGWNSTLSSGDIKLIGEMYPKRTVDLPISQPPVTSGPLPQCSDVFVEVAHNVFENGVKGMRIETTFDIRNARGQECLLTAYFYKQDGTPLKDFNNNYRTNENDVAAISEFKPGFDDTKFTRLGVFLPYDELHMGEGDHKLKFTVSLWDGESRNLYRSGVYLFNFTKGAIVNDLGSIFSFDNQADKLFISPQFVIRNGQNQQYQLCIFFYYQNDVPLHNSAGENLKYCTNFTPGYQTTYYNRSMNSDFTMNIPFSWLNLNSGHHDMKYYVALMSNGKIIAQSPWYLFSMDMN
jgi:serralysin